MRYITYNHHPVLKALLWITLTNAIYGRLVVSPPDNQFKTVHSGVIFTCSIDDVINSGTITDIRWTHPNGRWINDTKGRIFIENAGNTRLKLYITDIYEEDAGLYTCEANYDGKREYEDIRLGLYQDIEFEDGPTFIQQNVGASPMLPCIAYGQPEPTLSWRFERKKIPKEEQNLKYRYEPGGLRIFNIAPADNGTYECRAEVSSQGNFKFRNVVLDIFYPPIIHGGPTSVTAVEGDRVDLKCDASGNPSLTYEWSREQKMSEMVKIKVRLSGNGPVYTIRSMKQDDVGRYFCKVINSLGYDESFADIDIRIPPKIKDLPEKVVLEGRMVMIPCEATGDPEPSVTWMKDGEDHEYTLGPQPEDNLIHVSKTSSGLCKLIIYSVKKSHAGDYICIARNAAGESRERAPVTVDFSPTVNISESEVIAWPGQRRNITCYGNGLPLPTLNWFRGTQYITNNEMFRIETTRGDVVASTLFITMGDEPWIYDRYKCTSKNHYGYVTATVDVKEAKTPGTPKNIEITETKFESVSFTADLPKKDGGMPFTGWRIEYEEDNDHTESGVLDIDLGNLLAIDNLKPDTLYHLSLSAVSEVGYGQTIKFKVRTKSTQADNPDNHQDPLTEEEEAPIKEEPGVEEEGGSKKSIMEATKGGKKEMDNSGAVKMPSKNDNKFTVMVVGITVAIAVFLIFIIVVIVLVQKNKRRNNGLYFLGRKQVDYGTNAYIDGSDVDNIQLEIRKKGSPLPDVVHPDKVKSPMMDVRKVTPKVHNNRSVESNLANLAGKTPTTIQRQAWEMMKLRQDEIISDDEDDQFLEDAEGNPENLPLPPDYMLESGHMPEEGIGGLNQDDAASYQDIIEGYHSGDNMDEGEENDFEIRVPSGYEQNSYISYDPVT